MQTSQKWMNWQDDETKILDWKQIYIEENWQLYLIQKTSLLKNFCLSVA